MWKWLKRLFYLMIIGLVAGLLVVWAAFLKYSKDLPTLDELAHYEPSLVTRVFARDYQLLGEFFVERRQFVPLAEIPQMVINAFLAIEDTDFLSHSGINPRGILRAAYANFTAGRLTQGASTITQQVAKNFLLSNERTMGRKIKEVILAFRIEEQFTKEEILELYLNQIYLGAGAYGVGAAARIYFNRDISELELGQMALLAGLPKAPSKYSPWRYPEAAKHRQILVLNRMEEVGFITPEENLAAQEAALGLARPEVPLEQVSPHFLEHVRRTVSQEWGSRQLYQGGLDVFTTMDPRLQRRAQMAVRKGLVEVDRRHGFRSVLGHLNDLSPEGLARWQKVGAGEPNSSHHFVKGVVLAVPKDAKGSAEVLLVDGRHIKLGLESVSWARKALERGAMGAAVKKVADVLAKGDIILVEENQGEQKEPHFLLGQQPAPEAALVALDPHTGEILALVGGFDFNLSEFNRATQSRRQPGSSFKPFIYATAMEHGYSPASKLDDSPIPLTYRDPETGETKVWNPENYEHKYFGPTTLRVALEHSRNLVTIRLLKNVGLPIAIPKLKQMGFPIAADRANLSVALGSVDFTPMDMATGYAVLANGGKQIKPVHIARVQDRYGRTVFRHQGGDCLLCHQGPRQGVLMTDALKPVHAQFQNRVLTEEAAYQVTNMLKGVISHGTGQRAKELGWPLAGKTGTTNDMRDAWFIGYTPFLVTAVWVGKDDYKPLGPGETGAKAALPIWIDFMREALRGRFPTDFPVPAGIHLEEIDPETGRPPNASSRRVVLEAFSGDDDRRRLDEVDQPGTGSPGPPPPILDGGLY
ncbi:MAG: PBP1A family penicillin-binding protein [Magnetococcales bacterium]|nr:PBP1A family penicillin-binding protein [Magnetococcales bacterium]